MATYTNHTAGPRGINLKKGSTHWLEPGESIDLEDGEYVGDLPDLGKPGDEGELAVANLADAKLEIARLKARIAELEGAAPTNEQIAAAVANLDAANDDHWTKGGLPSVEAVEASLGKPVSRAQIEAAAPDAKRAV